jgi:hypothetical protein
MRSFKQHITEKALDTGYPVDGADFSNDLANPDTVERINAFLGALGQMEYLIPEHAINKVKEKLGRLGLSFGDVNFTDDSGEVSLPLEQFGGRFGKDIDTPHDEVVSDDGISHKVEGGLSINFVYERTNGGTYRIISQIS